MPKSLTTTADYRKLLADIRREMERGIKKVEDLLERQKVLSYWAIGRKINVYLNTRKMPPGAVGAFYDELSRDLEMHGRTLQQCEQFFRYFPKFKLDKDLKWSHYRFLLVVSDAAQRQAWIERIKKEGINTDHLRLMLMPAGATDDLPEFDLKKPALKRHRRAGDRHFGGPAREEMDRKRAQGRRGPGGQNLQDRPVGSLSCRRFLLAQRKRPAPHRRRRPLA